MGQGKKGFGVNMHVPDFEEFGFKVGPFLGGGLKCMFSTLVGNGSLKPKKIDRRLGLELKT